MEPPGNVRITRWCVRALLFDDANRLVVIKRTKADRAHYYTTPGGGIEPSDLNHIATLTREVREELGAVAQYGTQLTTARIPSEGGMSVQYFYGARLLSIDPSLRTGEEYADPDRGKYEETRIPVPDLADYDLQPTAIKNFVIANCISILSVLPAPR
jgi:8-oxo-dGTP pyrophosphatase MutT (NUDIX family)